MDGGEEIARRFVVAGCDGAEVLELVEEPLDEVAFFVEGEVGFALNDRLAFGGMTGVIPRS